MALEMAGLFIIRLPFIRPAAVNGYGLSKSLPKPHNPAARANE